MRNSSFLLAIRELPGGARQSEAERELTSERLSEGRQEKQQGGYRETNSADWIPYPAARLCKRRRNSRREKGKGIALYFKEACAGECMASP